MFVCDFSVQWQVRICKKCPIGGASRSGQRRRPLPTTRSIPRIRRPAIRPGHRSTPSAKTVFLMTACEQLCIREVQNWNRCIFSWQGGASDGEEPSSSRRRYAIPRGVARMVRNLSGRRRQPVVLRPRSAPFCISNFTVQIFKIAKKLKKAQF